MALTQTQAVRKISDERIADMWLKGKRAGQISAELGVSMGVVTGAITRFRNDLFKENEETKEVIAATAIAELRLGAQKAWEIFDMGDDNIKLRALAEIRRTNETIGKITGVISSRQVFIGKQDVKLFNFQDKYPDQQEMSVIPENEPPIIASVGHKVVEITASEDEVKELTSGQENV